MTPPGVTDWSRTRNRDGTGSRRGPVVRAAPGPFMGRQDMRGTGIHEPARALDVIQIPHRLPK